MSLIVETPHTSVKISAIATTPTCVFNTGATKESFGMIDRIGGIVISGADFFLVRAGMKVRKDLVASHKIDERYQPFLRGGNVNPHRSEWTGSWVCYDKSLEAQFSNQAFRDRTTFEAPSTLNVRQVMGKDRIYASLDEQQHFVDQSLYVLLPKGRRERLSYLLGLLCSKLIGYCFNNTLGDRKRTFPKIKGDQIAQLPIRPIDFDNPADVALHDKMVQLVERMLELNRKSRRLLARNPRPLPASLSRRMDHHARSCPRHHHHRVRRTGG